MTSNLSDRPNSLPWPPMLLMSAVVLAIALGRLWQLPALEGVWPTLLGGAVLLAGIGFDLWAIATMRHANTNVLPHRAADLLVTWGPFRFSRNPIYLGNSLLLLGIGLAIGNSWFVIFAFAVAVGVDRLAIRREECHLAARFGDAWTTYAAKTPRWLI